MENKMGTKAIPGLILGMSIPVIFSMLIQALYNVVDSIFVSRLGEDAIASVSLAFPIWLLVVAVFVGLQTGMSSVVSRRLGSKDPEGAALAGEHGVVMSGILFLIIFCVSFAFREDYFSRFTNNMDIVTQASTYTSIVLMFSFGIIITHGATGIMQGSGDMVKPMMVQLVGAVSNIILDPILIFGWFGLPAFGVRGAAIATVTGQILGMCFAWYIILSGKTLVKMNFRKFKFHGSTIIDILLVGVPSMIMQGLGSISLIILNLILSVFGDAAIAVMGVYFKIQSMVFMPLFGLAIGTLPVVGFNFGAKNKRRMGDAVKFSISIAIGFTAFCFLLFQLFPRQILGMFSPSVEMLTIGVPAFRTISAIFVMAGISILLSTAFQAFGKAYFSLIISSVRQLIVLLPVAWFLSTKDNVDYMWYAFVVAEAVGFIVSIVLFTNTFHKATSGWEGSHEVIHD